MARVRSERGAAFPSPVVILSVIAIAMAGIAFVTTGGSGDKDREVTTVSQPETSPTATPTTAVSTPAKPKPQAIRRGKVYVEVYNNSNIKGLAGRVADRATDIGWKVVGSDNWYGTVPATTVYYPERLKKAAKTLALDLGIRRTAPAVDPMRRDRLTVILTQPLS